MNMTDQELKRYTSQRAFTDPPVSARATRLTVPEDVWRSLEMVPGLLTWGVLVGCAVLSFFKPVVVAYFILLFDAYWLVKSFSLSHSLIRAYRYLKRDTRIDWYGRVKQLGRSIDTYHEGLKRQYETLTGGKTGLRLWLWRTKQALLNRSAQQEWRELRQELAELEQIINQPEAFIPPRDIHHLIFVATYTEDLDTLRPSFRAIANSAFDPQRLIVVLATEERDHDRAQANARVLKREFGDTFCGFLVTEHPAGIIGETKGKGSNISWAGRQAVAHVDKLGIPHEHVIVTTLDADHRPHPQYFAALAYHYALAPQRHHLSWQPTPLFHNNLWHTAAINRVTATGSSFWHMVESTRAYRLRNFAAHSQSLVTILATDFWSVDTIVEDGQQYWRTYFQYHGEHYVVPVYVPVYQDAVLGETYGKTLRAQYLQLRRWAWGASDFPYIVVNAIRDQRISWSNKLTQIGRFLEGHFTWATAPILITFVGWLPIILSPEFADSLFGQNLAPTASVILTLALVGMIVTVLVSMLLLPPKPPGYTERHRLLMIAQWVLLPITTIFFSSIPAIESQSRLMMGQYLEFRVTEKYTPPKAKLAASKPKG